MPRGPALIRRPEITTVWSTRVAVNNGCQEPARLLVDPFFDDPLDDPIRLHFPPRLPPELTSPDIASFQRSARSKRTPPRTKPPPSRRMGHLGQDPRSDLFSSASEEGEACSTLRCCHDTAARWSDLGSKWSQIHGFMWEIRPSMSRWPAANHRLASGPRSTTPDEVAELAVERGAVKSVPPAPSDAAAPNDKVRSRSGRALPGTASDQRGFDRSRAWDWGLHPMSAGFGQRVAVLDQSYTGFGQMWPCWPNLVCVRPNSCRLRANMSWLRPRTALIGRPSVPPAQCDAAGSKFEVPRRPP